VTKETVRALEGSVEGTQPKPPVKDLERYPKIVPSVFIALMTPVWVVVWGGGAPEGTLRRTGVPRGTID
jgi:hypothetical protein